MASVLRADVYVAPGIPFPITKDKPDYITQIFSPMSITLISGDREAVLVDALLTPAQADELADWVESVIPNKQVTTIYITHGHGDHFFGLSRLLKRFPHARAVTTAKVIEHMEQELGPTLYEAVWANSFGDQLDTSGILSNIEALGNDKTIYLEGNRLVAVDAGRSDTWNTTYLHVPSLNMVVAGDCVYNDVHQFLGETNSEEGRNAWISIIKDIAALKPHTVIAGHKRPGAVDGINNLTATIKYIEDFGELLSSSKSVEELFNKMRKAYPDRVNPSSAGTYQLWADAVDDQSYTFSNLLPYFKKSVNFQGADCQLRARNSTPEIDVSFFDKHGGPLKASYLNFSTSFGTWVAKGLRSMGLDGVQGFVTGRILGYSYTVWSLDRQRQTRSSSDTSFLRCALAHTTNLNVYTSTLAKRIVFNATTAQGVLVNAGGAEFLVTAKREVVLSAGAFRCPQLLLASGVGPRAQLEALDIPVVADRHGVWQNLTDHISFGLSWHVNLVTHSALGNP
ncbi:Glucose-methanol-choline oxidoreductase [Metarhizium guizhouense ARSEF 977]|uniref:Glucose-methanol-choline oxidoreductase n=1 Tax=Metarhizium guizhouense (strain ARSEF 977) TaxID=1276136 RepID=A0A0B4GNS8_METGA|nr:Glucose-methanol-choline oxidoreductase [Metarhizium guizhouense ARSEF 977]